MGSNLQSRLGEIMTKAWTDAEFGKKLKNNPTATFKELGIDIANDMEFVIVENTDKKIHLVFPTYK